MLGKYSPTVSSAYALDQNWHDKQCDDAGLDQEGYDSYGYNAQEKDRAGYTAWDYFNNEDLYDYVRGQEQYRPAAPTKGTPMHLTIEINSKFVDKQPVVKGEAKPGKPTPVILTTPPVDQDYWLFRVPVSNKQAIVGFPKFLTIGIGFQVEAADWNTNLPYTIDAKQIFDHIRANKGDDSIPDELCLKAIELVQDAAQQLKAHGQLP